LQMDEVGKTPDPKRLALLRLTVSATYTSGIVLDVSRLGMAAFSTPDEVEIFDAVAVGNPRHKRDALILLTARREGIPVVTNDGRLRNRCTAHGVEAMSPADLLSRLAD
jgi:predicted nucleic acid-binding protein